MSEKNGSLFRGLVAGLLGGLAGGWAKLAAEDLYPPRPDGREAPPALMIKKGADAVGASEPPADKVDQGTLAIHWGMSAVFGALYGVLAEPIPAVRAGGGAGYGLAVWIGAHELAIPSLGFSPPREELSEQEHRSEAISHLAFGVTLETVRATLRSTLLR